MRLSPETLFENWTPEASVWSPWAKPVVFATMPSSMQRDMTKLAPPKLRSKAIPPADGATALIIDLPGGESVNVGAALAAYGYQPVPLFNGVPAPRNTPSAVNNTTLARHLAVYADDVAEINLRPEAPPAFLIASDRMTPRRRKARPGDFDNRWMVFPQDFPSGHFLIEQRIDRAVVIQTTRPALDSDLSHVLLSWQKAGVAIEHLCLPEGREPTKITVRRPLGFRWLCRRALVTLGLRRNSAGGFGGVVPQPSEGGGGYYG
ncbi:MAG: hypothetical protein AAF333_17945 [Planctomycetota bacterium]